MLTPIEFVIGVSTRWRLLGAAFACAATFAVAVVASAPAQDLHQQLHHKQQKLHDTKAREGVLSTTIQRTNAELQRLKGQVASLRTQIDIAKVQLERVEAQLARDKRRLLLLRGRLGRAQDVLSKRLVDIYKSGRPDAMTMLLNAHGVDDLLTRYDYLKRIQQADADLVAGVRDLRNEQQATVERVTNERNDIADRKASLEASEQELTVRQGQLAVAQANRQHIMQKLKSNETELEGDVSAIQGQIAAQIAAAQAAQATSSAPTLPAAPPGQASSAGFIWPVNGPVTSPFCEPRPWESCHPGIDIAVPSGTPIRASAAGTVIFTTPEASSGGYGNYTCIDHGNSLSTCYAHQSSFATSQGAHVSQGQVIGYTDCTGLCFGPHLHFEVRINGQVTDPMAYLP